ncbi:MAG: hypothetical protein KatS3mg027_0159 [Bacteroidia bacterium]|nr:MAG: hypothetical protein KatS3mg027_0159 [Bacteroidia bacterium]
MPRIILLLFILNHTLFSNILSDTTLIKQHLKAITKTRNFRYFADKNQLNEVASYIEQVYREYSDSVYVQKYVVDGRVFKNIICSFGTENSRRIIVGAHYDVCYQQEGADDNASGVVALLELARLLKKQKLKYRIDLVAYSTEEPPYFRTENMGSYLHAKYLYDNKINVYGMISLEMIGYFSDEKNSQHYPIPFLKLFYGNKGNFITLVSKFKSGKFVKRFSRKFKSTGMICTKRFKCPKFIQGLDWSDHLNYWKFGYSALMITDTSFYRNPNYHETTDRMETLDIKRLSKVIDSVLLSLLALV